MRRRNDSTETDASPERPSTSGVGRLARFRPYGVEIFTWVNLAVTVLLLRGIGLRIDASTFEYTLGPVLGLLPKMFLMGLALAVGVHVLVLRRPLEPFLRRIFTPRWIFDWGRMWAVVLLTTYSYFWIKVNVPILNETTWDRELWQWDRLLHLGVSPSIFITALFRDTVLLGWMDAWYSIWQESVLLGTSCLLVLHHGRVRRRFTTALVLVWTLGAWLYVAMPAVGPIYEFTEHWHGLMGSMPDALQGQAALWRNYQTLLAGRAGEQIHAFNPTMGVAAMPSLHVAMHAFFALWAWRYLRPVFVLGVMATLLTQVGAVLTGWHYAVDGYVGAALAFVCLFPALRANIADDGSELVDDPVVEIAKPQGNEPSTDSGPHQAA